MKTTAEMIAVMQACENGKPKIVGSIWAGHCRNLDGLIHGTCDWKESWIDNPLYEGERA